jgi:secondary thiamine-phosphate synthase enzyme
VFVDLTDDIEAFVERTGLVSGMVNVQTLHTTTAIVVNEHEPLLLSDFVSQIERTAPAAFAYLHDQASRRSSGAGTAIEERANGHAHCRALLLCPSATLNVVDGRLTLGRWQRIFFAELDGPRTREVSVLAIGAVHDGHTGHAV